MTVQNTLKCRIKETIKLSSALFVLSAAVTSHQPQTTYPPPPYSLNSRQPPCPSSHIRLSRFVPNQATALPVSLLSAKTKTKTKKKKTAIFAQTLAESTEAHRENGTHSRIAGGVLRRGSGREVPGLKRKPLAKVLNSKSILRRVTRKNWFHVQSNMPTPMTMSISRHKSSTLSGVGRGGGLKF